MAKCSGPLTVNCSSSVSSTTDRPHVSSIPNGGPDIGNDLGQNKAQWEVRAGDTGSGLGRWVSAFLRSAEWCTSTLPLLIGVVISGIFIGR